MAGGERDGIRGFTLIELVIVLAVLAVILAMVAPMAFQLFSAEQSSAVENELQQIYRAIVGDPEKGIYGYAGDVGTYPKTLIDLVRQPLDSSSAPLPGWKGPYVQNARIENGVWLDPFGRPYEYYSVSGANIPDQLAIVSRGPDGGSTNIDISPDPSKSLNDSGNWGGLAPSAPGSTGYREGAGNADNVVFPQPNLDGKSLNVKTDGDLALNILNWDNNKEVNAFVPACPELYTVTTTSVPRGTVEGAIRYVQGLAFNLAQGQYRMTIVPQGVATTSWAETLTVQPGATLTRTLNLTGLDSSGTPLFNLTVTNDFTTTELEVYAFDVKLKGKLAGESGEGKSELKVGETRTYTPHGCAQIYVRKKSKSDVVDQFVMPYGAFIRPEGTSAATLVVKNLFGHSHHDHGDGHLHHHDDDHHHHPHGHHRVLVYRNDILLGTVNHHHSKTFKDLLAKDKITVFTREGTLLTTLMLVAGDGNLVTVGN
jgi:general secretion pathway protein G